MSRQISIVDVGTGEVTRRSAKTLSLGIPQDFDPAAREISVDADSLGHYASANGQRRVLFVRPAPLSKWGPGQRCLVAAEVLDASGASVRRCYRLCEVEALSPSSVSR